MSSICWRHCSVPVLRSHLVYPSCNVLNRYTKISSVNYLRLEARGLHLDSTATLHTVAGVQLWLPCPMHQGQVTTAPSCSKPVEARAFSSRCFSHQSDQHAGCSDTAGTRRAALYAVSYTHLRAHETRHDLV